MPEGQLKQRVEVLEPAITENKPAAQAVQIDDPTTAENVPGAQRMQVDAPAAEYMPATQEMHIVPDW